MEIKTKKKLIEVALPLEAINTASAREKSIRHGHPSTLHLWWARRPLAAARAVIFAQMVDDPASLPDLFPTEKAQEKERKRLFKIIDDLVQWENTTNEEVLERARAEIWQSWRRTCAENADHPRAKELFDRNKLPAFHDPFAGGGALPLEAQRLGFESYASDLNPVAVLINKAAIEFPPKFAGTPPINPEVKKNIELFERKWVGAEGLAEDVRYYGKWMRDEAEKRIGHLYPKMEITSDLVKERPDLEKYLGQKLTVIAWLWAHTVKSPNPAFASVEVPLASTFMLSTKAGKEAYVDPVIQGKGYRFTVKVGSPKNSESAKNGTKLERANFTCLISGTPISGDYIKAEGQAGKIGKRMMAIVAEGERERVYLPPTAEMEKIASEANPNWKPEVEFFQQALGFRVGNYGMKKWSDLFTNRQLVVLTTFSDLVQEVQRKVKSDAASSGVKFIEKSLEKGDLSYPEVVAVYMAFTVSKIANIGSMIASWMSDRGAFRETFARQALPMVWDFAEANPFSDSGGSLNTIIDKARMAIEMFPANTSSYAFQVDAALQKISIGKVVSTDPPYYDNIGYSDLSDFFYVWLRRSLKQVLPDLFNTLEVPKAEELVATPERHGGKDKASAFFLDGMTQAMHRLAEQVHPSFPVTIYYAFKQSESDADEGTVSTGWETFLDAVIRAGFAISGTWPMRTEGAGRMRGQDSNALASSIVLVCRPKDINAPSATRREFINSLKNEMQTAITHLQRGNIAPVDLAQAAIGPGMGIYTRYSKVLDAAGGELSVRESLSLINEVLDQVLTEQEGDFDADSRWALTWFEQSGFSEGDYGIAETLATARNTSISGMVNAGILKSGRGKVVLLKPNELPSDWDPAVDNRLTAWETVHHLIRVLEDGGENAAAGLVKKLGSKAELARELAYRLYTICERKKRAKEALSYNALVQSWPEITRLAREIKINISEQAALFGNEE